jgi:ubiquinone/menaquinone biosynthesis C-methylase UbiE
MSDAPLTIDQIERLAHYDLMAHLDSPSFAIGGIESSERLARICSVVAGQRVLFVGCGTGESARHWADTFEVDVTGIDSSSLMVARARERIGAPSPSSRVTFDCGNAYELRYPDACFDVVVTEFVSGFLDVPRAFREFHRVLRPRGRIGINELCREADAPSSALAAITQAERKLRQMTDLPFGIPECSAWPRWMHQAEFGDLVAERHPVTDYARTMLRAPERRHALDRMRRSMRRHARISERIRQRLAEMAAVERLLFSDAAVARHLRYMLIAGTRTTDRPG